MKKIFLITTPKITTLINSFYYIIAIYIYIYQPPVINKLYYIVFEILIFCLFLPLKRKFTSSFVKTFYFEIKILMLIIFISILRDIASGEMIYSDRFLAWGFQAFLFPVFIIYILNKVELDLIELTYWASFIGAIITTILILFPSIDNFYKTMQVDFYYDLFERFDVRHRAYGIAENLSFTYGLLMGVFAGYSLMMIRDNILFFIPTILFLVAVAFNARIGFFAIIPFIYFIATSLSIGRFIKYLVLSLIIFLFFDQLQEIIQEKAIWASAFFQEIYDFFSGKESATIDLMINDFIVLPDTFSQFLIGRGESLFLSETKNSDIGFILQLNYAGVFFLAVIILMILSTSRRLLDQLGCLHWYSHVFIVSILLMNTKGFAFAATPGGRFFFLIYCYLIYQKNNSSKSYV